MWEGVRDEVKTESQVTRKALGGAAMVGRQAGVGGYLVGL